MVCDVKPDVVADAHVGCIAFFAFDQNGIRRSSRKTQAKRERRIAKFLYQTILKKGKEFNNRPLFPTGKLFLEDNNNLDTSYFFAYLILKAAPTQLGNRSDIKQWRIKWSDVLKGVTN